MQNNKFQIDVEALKQKMIKKSYKLSDVKDRIEKVSWDIVRFTEGDDAANLWQVQSADDGEYIISLYEEAPEEVKTANSNWQISLSKTASVMDFYYKGDPIISLKADKLGLPTDDLAAATRYLPKKLSENKQLVRALLNELGKTAKNEVLNKYPELRG